MALVDLTSDLSKFRADFSTPPLADKPYTAKLPTQNSKFDQGTVTIENQLGKGSVFNYVKGGAATSKIFSTSGYSFSRKYSDLIKGGRGQDANSSLLYKKSTETNSPSAIDEQYKKYSLQDEAFNFQYIRHPLITRGIQRKGNEKPNRWGVDALVNFDDGLVRGGITTVVDRLAIDTARIAKWMASPKGLLWIVKQVGLGLSNPNVEKSVASTLLGIPQTKVHTGLASLLSVPGTPLGLHFTRHGIPFLNELASYENVIKTNQLASLGGSYSRLIKLRTELGLNTQSGATIIQSGMPILSLSSLTGPQSVYGIGTTLIKRSTQTISNRLADIEERFNINPYTITSGYSTLRGFNSSITFPANSYIQNSVNLDLNGKSLLEGRGTVLKKASYTPGSGKESDKKDISTSETRKTAYPNAPSTGINSYITLAYGKIPKDADRKKFRDFRNDLSTDGIDESTAKGI